MLYRVKSVTVLATDLEKSRSFYQQLGFTINQAGPRAVRLTNGELTIHLFISEIRKNSSPIDLVANGTFEEFEALKQRLATINIDIGAAIPGVAAYHFSLRDPDENLVAVSFYFS